jgi:hypothetical protein
MGVALRGELHEQKIFWVVTIVLGAVLQSPRRSSCIAFLSGACLVPTQTRVKAFIAYEEKTKTLR